MCVFANLNEFIRVHILYYAPCRDTIPAKRCEEGGLNGSRYGLKQVDQFSRSLVFGGCPGVVAGLCRYLPLEGRNGRSLEDSVELG